MDKHFLSDLPAIRVLLPGLLVRSGINAALGVIERDIAKRLAVRVKLVSDRTFDKAHALNELDLLIDELLHIEQRTVSAVVNQHDVVEFELGRLHAVEDRFQRGYVIDGTLIGMGENDFSVSLVADEGVVDLFEIGISFGVTVLGDGNRLRIGRDRRVVQSVAQVRALSVLQLCDVSALEEILEALLIDLAEQFTDSLISQRLRVLEIDAAVPLAIGGHA